MRNSYTLFKSDKSRERPERSALGVHSAEESFMGFAQKGTY